MIEKILENYVMLTVLVTVLWPPISTFCLRVLHNCNYGKALSWNVYTVIFINTYIYVYLCLYIFFPMRKLFSKSDE